MDTQKSGLVTALEYFWNGCASARKDIMLIVCASATSWMLDNIIHNKGGLYNRITNRIHLKAFNLSECKEFVEANHIAMNDYQILECYMIMGGVPYYWTLLDRSLSLPQNIDRIFFKEDAPLKDEFEYLYRALFNNPEKYIEIINAFGRKKAGLTREELCSALKLKQSGVLSKKLADLEACGFVRKFHEFEKKNRGAVYQLIDNFTLFYFKFMEHTQTDEHFWENQHSSPTLNAWRGLAFERVCLQHIDAIKKKLGISGVLTDVCAWSCKADPNKGLKGSQIDLLIVRKDQVINLCEMKFCADNFTVTQAVDESLRKKISDLYTATNTKYAVQKTIITTYGLTDNMYSGTIQSCVTAKDLFA